MEFSIMNDATNLCPCCSGKTYEACCKPIIEGTVKAETPEALMRARYSAYAVGAVDFIMDSVHSAMREDNDRAQVEAWSKQSVWKGLEILRTEKGGPDDEEGVVEFIAKYESQGVPMTHHEIAQFRRQKGEWRFYDGEIQKQKPYTRASKKIGPNDPCPCGSGKKYKKCCGK